MAQRKKTITSNFGVSTRESHDSTPFYERFRAPELSSDETVLHPAQVVIDDPFVCGDARHMDAVPNGSVALVVTSPPYFAGKQYEEELERDGVPSSYLEYLDMLRDVFAECVRVLEPGGRIAVNVANLGRKPYRSLSADVIRILEHDLGLLLRGEVIWQKGEGASGSCAWGSYRSPANPVLRDISERVIIASKGRFDRALSAKKRAALGLPHQATVITEDFLSLTLDVWHMPPESAKRVGHPAPFPVELPEQLIRLFTYENDLVLDPFLGSGSTLVAASQLRRRYVGYDLDPTYVTIAKDRVAQAAALPPTVAVPEVSADKLAERVLGEAGFVIVARDKRMAKTGVAVSFAATDPHGRDWLFDIAGPNTTHRGGMLRTDVVWRALGRAAAIKTARGTTPLVLLTTALPRPKSDGAHALAATGVDLACATIDIASPHAIDELASLGRDRSID